MYVILNDWQLVLQRYNSVLISVDSSGLGNSLVVESEVMSRQLKKSHLMINRLAEQVKFIPIWIQLIPMRIETGTLGLQVGNSPDCTTKATELKVNPII